MGAIESIRDITEYKQAEQKLQTSEENYREIFNASNDALFIHDLKTGAILDVNQKACEMYKCSREEFINSLAVVGYLSFGEPPYTEQDALQWIHKASSEGPQTFEWRGRDRENRIFWAEVNLKHCVIRGCDRILAVVREITERKQADEALKVSEERFRIAAETTNDLIWEWNIVNGTLEWFGAIDEKLGYLSGEFPRTIEAWENSIHPDDHDRVMASLDRHLKTKAPYCEKYYIKRKDGTFRFWTDQGKAVWDAEGNPLKMIGACTDITERKQAEEALRQSQLQQKALLDNIPDAAWLKDSESRFVAVNEALAKASGYSAENLVGKTDFEIWSKDAAELNRSEDQEIIATKQKKVIEKSFMDSSGKVSWVEKIKTPILGEKGKVIGTAGISRDITKRKQTEQELRENEKKYRSLYQEFQGILDAIPDSLSLISPDLKIVWANKGLAMLLHKNLPDLLGQYCYQVRHGRSEPCEICPAQRCFRSKKPEFDEVTTPDGRVWDRTRCSYLG